MTLKVLLVLVVVLGGVFGLPRSRRHHDRDYGHHDHHHVEYDHHHDVHHGGHRYSGHHHSDHHGGFHPHHDHRFRRAASPEELNGLRKARHHGGGFDAPYESFGEHGSHLGYQLHKHKRPIHGHKKTGFSSSSAIAQSINTPYGITHTVSKTHTHSGTIDTFGKKR